MHRSRATLLLIACLFVASCAQGAPPLTPPPTAQPLIPLPNTDTPLPPTDTAAPARPDRSIVVISFDGGRADTVYQWMEEGLLPNFSALAERGLRAEYAQSVDPPLTTAAQNSISTGSYPSHHGLVSNSFHNPADSFYWYRRGLDELLDQAEPVWVTASNAGFTTAALFFVGGSPMQPGQTADYSIGYGVREAYSRQVTVELAAITDPWQGETAVTFSPPLEGSFTIPEVKQVQLLAWDSTDDGMINYDMLALNISRALDSEAVTLGVKQWGSLVLLPTIVAGADFLFQNIIQEGEAHKVTLFYSNVYHNTASPRELLKTLNEKFGFFPAGHDYYALEHGWITEEDDMWLLERQSRWTAQVAAWVIETYHPDLTFTWQDGFDAVGHSYMMVNENQFNYSPEKAQQYLEFTRRAARVTDEALGIMLDAIDLATTSVLLVADHGMAPLHTIVYVNTILEQAGLLTLDRRNYVVVDETKALAVASGGSAHIYINLEGEERDGWVPQEEYTVLQGQIVELFSSLTYPNTSDKVFQRVLLKEELAEINLDHPNSGDVFVQAIPGYHLDGWRGNDYIFAPANFYGQHGYASSLPEMFAMFIAAGFGIPSIPGTIPPVRIIDYAPTIAAMLGFPPAPTVDGQPIPALTGNP